ncbi:MAG: polyprenyl synthetase family protein [Spirochaetes bacterium]|nr:polyprenyl synthetase family protein [Spirochaetota bacterium]
MKEILYTYSEQIKKQFSLFLDEKGKYFNNINKWGMDITHRLKQFSKNGKMIRGSVVLFTQEMFGKKADIESIKVAVAIELFHAGLLIHDDIIDKDDLRRGEMSVHYQYTGDAIAENMPDPHQFGISMGICAGDISFFIGFELLSGLIIDLTSKEKIMRLFFSEFTAVGLGQMQDIYFGQSMNEPCEDDIFRLYLYKTARYTFSLPFMLGGMLAGISDQELKKLEKLGEYLGLIFQLKDDELGLFGTKDDFGKPIGSDIKENKKTLYHLYLLQYASVPEQTRLKSIFGKSNISVDSINYVHELVRKYKIKDIIDNKVNEYKTHGEEIINGMSVDNLYKSRLNEIMDFSLNRTK